MDFENLKKKLSEAAGTMQDTAKQQQANTQDASDPAFIPGESNGLMGLMAAAGKLKPDPLQVPGGSFNGREYPGLQMDPGSVMGSMKLVGGLNDAAQGAKVMGELTPQQQALKALDPSASTPNMTMDQLKMITQKKSRLMDLLQKNQAAR